MQPSEISFLRNAHYSFGDTSAVLIAESQIIDTVSHASVEISSENEQVLSRLSSFIMNLNSDNIFSKDTGIMPPGVLHIDSNLIIFERPPQYQNIQIIPQIVDHIDYDRHDTTLYRLPVPWQLYVCTYSIYGGRYYPNSVRMYFMNSSITGSDISNHRVYLPTLPNFYTSGLLCNPMYASMEDVERYDNSIAGVIQASYDWVWNSGTNLDLTMNIVEAYFQLLPLKAEGIPTVFDKDLTSSASQVHISSYFLDFSSIDFFFKLWEQFDIHEVSSLVWPNSSTSDRVATEVRSVGESFLQDFFAENNITDPPYRVETSECDCQCDDEECDCECECDLSEQNVYLYNQAQYGRYVRSRLSSMTTCGKVLDHIRAANHASNAYDEYTILNISRAIIANSSLTI